MSIVVKCDCGKTLTAPDEYAGRTAKCKACGASVLVPDLAPAVAPPPPTPPPAPASIALPADSPTTRSQLVIAGHVWTALAVLGLASAVILVLAGLGAASESGRPGMPPPDPMAWFWLALNALAGALTCWTVGLFLKAKAEETPAKP